jgi:toxin-antitoxin system PIN domain toxin
VILFDVNVLVYAHREDAPNHPEFLEWLEKTIADPAPFGLCDPVMSGFMRVVTHPRIFDPPSSIEEAVAFLEALRGQPNAVLVGPGERHWDILVDLCRRASVRGNLVPDAYLAALAIESGNEWISTDRDFARFPGLRWRHPLE